MELSLTKNEIYLEKEKIIKDLGLEKEALIFLSGSLIEGIGNEYSDLDIFILTSKFKSIKILKSDYQNIKNVKTVFRTYFGKKCDMEIYNMEVVKSCINILDFNFDIKKRVHSIFSEIPTEIFLSFIHRLLVGKCINNEKEFENLISKINKDNYFYILKTLFQNELDNKYEDLLGNRGEENIGTCVLIGNFVVSTLISYYLVKNFISIDRKKWGYLKLKKFSEYNKAANEFLKKVEKFLFLKLPLNEYSESLIRLINEVVE